MSFHYTSKTLGLCYVLLTFYLAGHLVSCTQKKDDSSTGQGYTGVASVALTNIDNVEKNYTPDSMQISTATVASYQALAGGLCGTKNLFACQPNLLRLYLAVGKSHVNMMKTLLAGISSSLSNIGDGANGHVSLNDTTTLYYNKTSATVYSVLAQAGVNPYFYFNSSGTAYTLEINWANLPAASRTASDPTQGKIKVMLTYTDSSHWLLDIFAYGYECKAAEPTAPNLYKMLIKHNESTWNGKTMLYSGHGLKAQSTDSEVTCSTAESDAGSVNTYTEFFGDSVATKAQAYMLKRDVTAATFASNANDYALNNFCNSYAGNWGLSVSACVVTVNSLWNTDLANFANPYCKPADASEVTWGNNCTTVSTTVSGGSFDDADVPWVAPNVLYSTSFDLPTSI